MNTTLSLYFQRAIFLLSISEIEWVVKNRSYLNYDFISKKELHTLLDLSISFYDEFNTIADIDIINHKVNAIKDNKARNALKEELKECLALKGIKDKISYITKNFHKFILLLVIKKAIPKLTLAIAEDNIENISEEIENIIKIQQSGKEIKEITLFNEKDIADRYKHKKINIIPTLYPTLDSRINGGFCRGEETIIVAPPARGKSVCLINFGVNLIFQGFNVLHVTLELSYEKTANRYDSRITGINKTDLQSNLAKIKKVLADFYKKHNGELHIVEYPARSITVRTIENLIKRYNKGKSKIDVLILDYGDELKRNKNELATYAIGDNFAELRALAMKYNIVVLTATQTKQSALDKEILDLNDMSDSWDKAKVADNVLALCQTIEEEELEIIRMVPVKLRENKKVRLPIIFKTDFDKATMLESANLNSSAIVNQYKKKNAINHNKRK